jgi:hypothetical protein
MKPAPSLVCLLLALGLAAAGRAGAAETQAWWAYRDAYRVLVRFEKQSRPKHLIQQQLQVQALASGLATEGLRLTLSGPGTALELPLDGALQARVPLLKSAYDDNAALRLNRSADAFALRSRVSISPRADGQYPVDELRQACEQALDFLGQVDAERHRGKRCVGVSLAFARQSLPAVSLRRAGISNPLTPAAGPLYPGEPDRGYPVVQLRWADWADGVTLVAPLVPLVIAPLFD